MAANGTPHFELGSVRDPQSWVFARSPSGSSRRLATADGHSRSSHAAYGSGFRMPSSASSFHAARNVDQARLAEHVPNGAAQRLGPVDHEQPPAIRLQPALDHFLQHASRHRRVLRGAFAKPQHVLPARSHRRPRRPARGSPRTGSRQRKPPTRSARSGSVWPTPAERACPLRWSPARLLSRWRTTGDRSSTGSD